MKPKITITSPDLGMVENIVKPISNGCAFSLGIDTQTIPGIMQVSYKLTNCEEIAATSNITEVCLWIINATFSSNIFYPVALSGSNSRLYGYGIASSGKWGLIHIDAQVGWGQGLANFNNEFYWASNSYLGRMTAGVLNEDLDISENAIDLVDSTIYSATGSIIIGTEIITYTGNAGNTLTGCTRGAYGSTAATHTNGVAVYGFNDTYKAITTDTSNHPMVVFGDYLVLGSGRYVEHLSSGGTLTAQAVDLPLGWKIKSLAVYNNKLYIGTWKGADIYDYPQAKLFSCTMEQMLSGEFEEVLVIHEPCIHCLRVWKNNLIMFAGISGGVYAFNGATLSKIAQIPYIKGIPGNWGFVYPGSIMEYQGNLYFGYNSVSSVYSGLWMLDSNLALTAPNILSSAHLSATTIGGMLNYSSSLYFIAYYDDAATNKHGIDILSQTARLTTGAIFESQIYNVAGEEQPVEINGIEILQKTLPTDCSIVVKYKKDQASNWSTWDTITSLNQASVIWTPIGQCKTIQIRLELTTAGTSTTPEIIEIKIY
jgi:hypothetical protein